MSIKILIIISALFLLMPVSGYSAPKHECSFCHIPGTGGKGMVLLKESVNDLCLECHPGRKGMGEHKVDIVPSMPVDGLPLDKNGKITCVTCHDPHRWESPSLLRMERTAICLKCHP